jgi:hypothetical protein
MKGESKAMLQRIAGFLAERGARRVSVFGSRARDDARPGSDIDILVDFSERKSLLDLVGMEQELSESIGMNVDLVTEKSVSPLKPARSTRTSRGSSWRA